MRILFLTLILLISGGHLGTAMADQEQRFVEGVVVEVVDRTFDEVETLRIEDRSGTVWTFTTFENVGTTPANLREHQLFGNSVTVTFEEKAGPGMHVLVASRIDG